MVSESSVIKIYIVKQPLEVVFEKKILEKIVLSKFDFLKILVKNLLFFPKNSPVLFLPAFARHGTIIVR